MIAATEYTGRNRRKKDDQLEHLLEEVSTRTVNKLNPQYPRRFAHISPDEHERHHRMCESAIEFLDRLNNTKWGILKAVGHFYSPQCLELACCRGLFEIWRASMMGMGSGILAWLLGRRDDEGRMVETTCLVPLCGKKVMITVTEARESRWKNHGEVVGACPEHLERLTAGRISDGDPTTNSDLNREEEICQH